MRKILFTICGRAGSKGLKNKNIKKLDQIPIVYYSLAAINLYYQEHTEDKIYVCLNTDSAELIKQIKGQEIVNDIVIVDRKKELSEDTTPKVAVIQDTYLSFKEKVGEVDHVIDLDITSPMRRTCDIEEAITKMEVGDNYKLVLSVVKARRNPYFNMVEKDENGLYRIICKSGYTARQQAPPCFELNASIYNYSPEFLKTKITKSILEYSFGIVIMPDYLVLDIDSEKDFDAMEVVLHNCRDYEIRKLIEVLQPYV